ncbi:MAG: hypothetical protein M3069_10330 [Chloroflexota bacterium]|nr:hypothetical protein [Chloroflexota bacterium]
MLASWMQGIGSLLMVLFALGVLHLVGATRQLAGVITLLSVTAILGISLVECEITYLASQRP